MTSTDLERLTITTDDQRQLDVLVSGRADATTVVVHMGCPNGLVPLPSQIDPSRQGLRTVLYARPGYCGSTAQPERVVADAASDTACILDALKVDAFVNAGLSMGGPHALGCAAMLPERCLATAVIAGVAPYPSEVWPDDALPLTRAGGDAFTAALEKDRAQSLNLKAQDMATMFPSAPDSAALTGAYAEWLASYIRSAWAAGIAGVRDDNRVMIRDWGFNLADARQVAIWHGDQDAIAPPAHGHWLAEHLPGAELHLLPQEGHISILLRLPEILSDLVERAGGTTGSM